MTTMTYSGMIANLNPQKYNSIVISGHSSQKPAGHLIRLRHSITVWRKDKDMEILKQNQADLMMVLSGV